MMAQTLKRRRDPCFLSVQGVSKTNYSASPSLIEQEEP
jgi:hypothetical protein